MYSFADVIIEENISQVLQMLQGGNIALNELDEYGFTPLVEAAVADNLDIARLLIDYGADVNFQDSIGNTALHWAAENNNLALCELLLEKGANPNAYTLAGQPILVMPLLRKQQSLKKLLMDAGANLDFTQDYINAKFLGHLFELVGTANLIDPYNQFVEVDFEGFYLEVTLAMIGQSLEQFKSHFAGRQIRRYGQYSEVIIKALAHAGQLIKYQQYRVDTQKYAAQINSIIQSEPLIIPIAYEGHAITFIKFKNIFVKCDRREDSRLYDNVVFYHMSEPDKLSGEAIKHLIYEKQSSEFINHDLPAILGLEPITELKISAQISGNCSWANVEACIPVLFFLLFSSLPDFQAHIPRYKSLALEFFQQWREWNKDRSLNFCIQSFYQSDSIRKACKAEILAAILFQCCNDGSVKNTERAERILAVLKENRYIYLLENYVKSYCYEDQSPEGKNFIRLLQAHGIRT